MLRFTVLAILLAAACAVPVENDKPQKAEPRMAVVENLEEYLLANPGVEVLVDLEKNRNEHGGLVSYTLGERLQGDELIFAEKIAHPHLFQRRNLSSRFNYPSLKNGGSLINYVKINVGQTTDKGRAVIVDGGINQRSITIIVEAKDVYFFELNAQIFGRY